MSVKDPRRLLDSGSEASPAMRKAVEAWRSDLPRADQLERLARRLPFGGGGPPDGGEPPPRSGTAPPPAPAPGVAILPAALAGGALALAVLGVRALLPDNPHPTDPSVMIAQPIASATPISSTSTLSEQAHAATDDAKPRGSEPSEAEPREAKPKPFAPPAPSQAAPSGGGGASSAIAQPSANSPPAENESEIALLERAQRALGSSPATALELAGRHAARFGSGSLGQEREVIAITALVRLGRTSEANARARAFARRFPASAHLRRIEALVASAR